LDADADSGKAEIASAFLEQYYINQTKLPSEILLPLHIDDEAQTEELLSEDKGSRVRLTVPEKGRKKELLKLAEKDVSETESLQKEQIENRMERLAAAESKLREASGISGPEGLPLRLEAYDISNTGGSDSVAAMVVFVGGEKKRSAYRRFRIRSEDGGDDYGAMQETVYRRLRRGLDGDPGFIPLPDIILVDGGKGHVSAVRQITAALKTSIPVLGMVKDDRHRTRGLITDGGEMDISKTPDLYRLIGVIQEEVHRFAIEYHRGLRGKKASGSELDGIPGIGEKRRNALLVKFGSIAAISGASPEQLAETPGMNLSAAQNVSEYFKNKELTGGT
jgi:excinuclease ABC subunit C